MNAVRHDRQMEMYVGLQKQQHKMYGPKKKKNKSEAEQKGTGYY